MNNITRDCIALVASYQNGKISVDDLIASYFGIYLVDNRSLPDGEFMVLDEIFACLDGYTTDSDLLNRNPDYYLNEEQLRECLKKAVAKLSK